MLSKDTKLAIYDLLGKNFRKGNLIPVADLEKLLNDNGLDPREFHYPNIRVLLKDLPEYLELREVGAKGHKRNLMLFSNWTEKGPQDPAPAKKQPAKDVKNVKKTAKPVSPTIGKKEPRPAKTKPAKRGLPKDEKERIYQILLNYLPENQKFPLATVAQLLRDNGVDQKAFGYSKMKGLIQDLDCITFSSVTEKGMPQDYLQFRKRQATETGKPEPKPQNSKPKQQPQPQRQPEQGRPDEKKDTNRIAGFLPENQEVSADTINIPEKLILSLKEATNLGYDNLSFIDMIVEDLNASIKSHTYHVNDDAVIYPLSVKNRDGERLIAALKKAEKGCSYRYYINYIGFDKEKAKDILKREIHFEDFDASIHALSRLARPEPWHYIHSKDDTIILKIYLQYTYYRVVYQKKLMLDPVSGFVAFNTGLVSENYEEIYGVLMRNTDKNLDEPYLFQGFTVAGSQGIGKVIVEHFSPLPKKATYINSPEDIYFDTERPLHIDYTHIINDNISRFPIEFLSQITLMFPKEHALVLQIQKERNDYQKDKLYLKLEEQIARNPQLFDMLKAMLDSAVRKAISMARSDYRAPLPSFFPTRNVMSMMLPLIFDIQKGPQAVLLVELTPSGNYQGQTILTLKQCYVNARLIAPVDNTFLDAEHIED